MSKIDKEINELAEKMEKSTKDSKELLFNTVMELGPEGLKKAIPNLTDENKEVLETFLKDFKKAKDVSMDDEYSPKRTYTEAEDLRTESLSGSDDEDEDLVKEKSKEHKHQGDNTPEGYEGQVIKAKGECGTKEHKEHHKELDSKVDKLEEMEEKEHGKELDEDKEVKKAAPKGVDPEKYERCVRDVKKQGDDKDPWAICAASLKKMGYEKGEVKDIMGKMGYGKMSKSEESVEKADSLEETRRAQETKMDKVGSGKSDKLLEEEKQSKMSSQSEGKKEKIEEEDGELKIRSQETSDEALSQLKKDGMKKSEEASSEKEPMEKAKSVKHYVDKVLSDKLQVQDVLKEAPDEMRDDILAALRDRDKGVENKEEKEKEVKKSIKWAPKNPLAAGSLGRNTHWNVDEYIVKSDQDFREKLEKGAMYLNAESGEETLQKSESKEDLNDIIEKSLDTTWDDIEHKKKMEEIKKSQDGKLVKSFEESEIAAALGLSEEDAKKFLGE